MKDALGNFVHRMIVVPNSRDDIPIGVGWSLDKTEHPWSYQTIDVFAKPVAVGSLDHGSLDSDRLMMWDHEKYNRCCREVWNNEGQAFYDRSANDISHFLSLYLGYKVIVHLVQECCNAATGVPIWHFEYGIMEERPKK